MSRARAALGATMPQPSRGERLVGFGRRAVTGLLLSGSPDDGGVIGRVKAVPASPGRAQVVARSGDVYRAQLAWQPRSQ